MLKGNVSENVYYTPEEEFLNQSQVPNWDNKGNLFFTDEYGNIINKNNISFLDNLQNKLKAFGTNLQRRINNPTEEEYKNSANTMLSLETLPIGASAGLTNAISKPLLPYFGKKISSNIAQGIGAGGLSGAVEGFGQGLINQENPFLNSLKKSAIGGLTGGIVGGVIGNVGKNITKRKLATNHAIRAQYIDDYVEGLSDSNYVGRKSRLNRELENYRGATQKIYNSSNPQVAFEFAGENSKTADLDRLKYAKKYIKEGHDPERIRQDFGWFQGKDGKWRYEIPSGEMKPYLYDENFPQEDYVFPLKKIYDNKELYAAYPDLAKLKVYVRPYDLNAGIPNSPSYIDSTNSIHLNRNFLDGYNIENPKFTRLTNRIKLLEQTKEYKEYKRALDNLLNNPNFIIQKQYKDASDKFYNSKIGQLYNELDEKLADVYPNLQFWNEDAKGTLTSEIQRLIQDKEGFAQSYTDEMLSSDLYKFAGENEVNAVRDRANLTPEQVRKTPIKYRVPLEQQILNPEILHVDFKQRTKN